MSYSLLELLFPPFIFGALGGISSWIMYFHKFASDHLRLVHKLEDSKLKRIKMYERDFLFKSFFVYSFIGGIAGVIAINTFNTSATGFPLFSISVIAGLSGMTFLKRSSLVDDMDTKKLMDISFYELFEKGEKTVDETVNKISEMGDMESHSLSDAQSETFISPTDLDGLKRHLVSEGYSFDGTDENLNILKRHVTIYLDSKEFSQDRIVSLLSDDTFIKSLTEEGFIDEI